MSFFLSLYFMSLVFFSFVSQPMSFCLILACNALSLSAYVYLAFGMTWYLILFGLVYVGGVYVLFIFVSVHMPNLVSGGFESHIGYLFLGLGVFSTIFSCGHSSPYVPEASHYLCSFMDGWAYCVLCLGVMVGFMVIGVVFSRKGSFFR